MKVITRFAPSPTGNMHVGNLRTALFSWLYARKNNGKFLLRIEDTDFSRYEDIYVNDIFFLLRYFGLYWDENVYFQSKRLNLYKKIIKFMLYNNMAYKCFCTTDRLNKIRYFNKKNKRGYCYDKFCRNKKLDYDNKSYVVRFKNPLYGYVYFYDFVYNKLKILNSELDDFIILRSNGIPTYNFCSVIDDNEMNITHVIRGDDHLNNTFKQVNIFNCLNYKLPIYVHLPMILSSNKKKLSKRDGFFDVKNYLNEGILPEAILNYLIRLGWSYGNKEIFSINEMKLLFDISNINKSSSIVNYCKLIWINKYYISSLSYSKLFSYLKIFFINRNLNINSISNISEIISFLSNKSSNLNDIANNCVLFDDNKILYDKKFFKNKIYLGFFYKMIKFFIYNFYNINYWSLSNINKVINFSFFKFNKLKKKDIFIILRYFLIAKKKSFSLNQLIFLLKKEKIIFRLKLVKNKFFS